VVATHTTLENTLRPASEVFVFDTRASDERIDRAVSDCGARAHWIDEFSALAGLPLSSHTRIALVAVRASSGPDLALDVIRVLKQTGFAIIGYGEEAESWPLGVRCRGLLAGACCVLDSSRPVFSQELRRVLSQLLDAEALRRDGEETVKATMRTLGIIGESQALVAVFRTILQASPLSDLPVLITGETGTGKELVARAIHQLDRKRRSGPFIALNASAISPGLAESELFGHRRGAFTGANRDRKGLFRAAQGGMLFLDEIGELDAALQGKLLRVLQDHRVIAVGDDEEAAVDVRVIAATNRDLQAMVQQSKFRDDLFHRINVLTIHVPPLRERRDDVRPLAEHFVQKYHTLSRSGAPAVGQDFVEALMGLGLPGNARELENIVRRALINKHDESALTLADLPAEIWQRLSEEATIAPDQRHVANEMHVPTREPLAHDLAPHLIRLLESNGWNLTRSLLACERSLLEFALRAAHHNQSQTARLLGITPRSVYNKIRKHRLQR